MSFRVKRHLRRIFIEKKNFIKINSCVPYFLNFTTLFRIACYKQIKNFLIGILRVYSKFGTKGFIYSGIQMKKSLQSKGNSSSFSIQIVVLKACLIILIHILAQCRMAIKNIKSIKQKKRQTATFCPKFFFHCYHFVHIYLIDYFSKNNIYFFQ